MIGREPHVAKEPASKKTPKNEHRIIVPLPVNDILNEQIAKKLA